MRTLQCFLGVCVFVWVGVCTVVADSVEYNTEENNVQDDPPSFVVGLDDGKMGPGEAKSLYPAPICNLQPSFANYCHHRGPGLYTYTADYNCFIQCDEWGKTYIKPCAYGTFWKPDGYEPTLYNRCIGRKPVPAPSPYRNLQTSHVRTTHQYTNPANGQNVVHTQGHRLTSYARQGFQPTPTPLPTGPLHKNDLVNMYINGKPNLNRYVYGKSGDTQPKPSPMTFPNNQPQVHSIRTAVSQPPMQPRNIVPPQQQPMPQQQLAPQTQIYNPAPPLQNMQMNRLPAQPLAQRMQLPSMPMQQQQQPMNMINPIQIKPINIQPIKLTLPQQQPQQQQQPTRITLNSRFPMIVNKGQGQLNLPRVNTANMMSNGGPVPSKQFNLQKQKLLAKNFQLPGLRGPNNIAGNNPGAIRNPGFMKKNLLMQKKRSQNVGRPNLRKIMNMRRRQGNQKGKANARLLAERKRRLQQWRQFMKNKKQGGARRGRLNGQGGGDGRITTAILNDQNLGNTLLGEDQTEDYDIAPADDGNIDVYKLFGEGVESDADQPIEYDNNADKVPLFDFIRSNVDTDPLTAEDVNISGSADESSEMNAEKNIPK